MKEAHDIASKIIQKTTARGKKSYDKKRQSAVLSPGDRVLVRNMSERGGPGKLRSYWEDKIHIVVSRKGESSPVYEVKPERGTGRNRILHRNMLMSCNALPLEEPAQSTVQRQTQRKQRKAQQDVEPCVEPDETEESASLDEDEYYWANRLRHRHHQPEEQNASPPAIPNTAHPPQLDVDAEEFRMENPVQMFMDNNTSDTQERTQTVQPADLPNVQENYPFDTQPRRSQREKRPRETLTYETLGHPVHRLVGLHINPLYVNALAPAYGQCNVPWPSPQVFGTYMVHPIPVPVGYY